MKELVERLCLFEEVEELFLVDEEDGLTEVNGVFYSWPGESLISCCVITQTRLVGSIAIDVQENQGPTTTPARPSQTKTRSLLNLRIPHSHVFLLERFYVVLCRQLL